MLLQDLYDAIQVEMPNMNQSRIRLSMKRILKQFSQSLNVITSETKPIQNYRVTLPSDCVTLKSIQDFNAVSTPKDLISMQYYVQSNEILFSEESGDVTLYYVTLYTLSDDRVDIPARAEEALILTVLAKLMYIEKDARYVELQKDADVAISQLAQENSCSMNIGYGWTL